MKRKIIFTALLCALLFTLLGCGMTNKLQTITISIGDSSGMFNLQGAGGTLQLKVTGNYSNSKTHDLTNVATYTIVPDGNALVDDGFGGLSQIPLLDPPQTITLSKTGLATAVDPFACTWINLESDPTKTAKWALTGSYKVTASFGGVTSQPVYIAVASAVVGGANNGACGPTS